MAKKKAKKQADVTVGEAVVTDVVINSMKIGKSSDELSFTALKPQGHETLARLVENEERVSVTISLKGKPDPKFAPMEAYAIMTGYKINKTSDSPTFKGLKFSPGQHERISRLIESEEEVVLTLQQVQKELEFPEEKE